MKKVKNKCNISDKKTKQEITKKSGDVLTKKAMPFLPIDKPITKLVNYTTCLWNARTYARLELFFNSFAKSYYNDEDIKEENTNKLFNQLQKNSKFEEELYDYCESVRKTSSKLAITTLALIYCDYYKQKINPDLFCKKACKALSEISDEALEYFLLLVSEERILKKTSFCLHFIANIQYPEEIALDIFNELKNHRNMLLLPRRRSNGTGVSSSDKPTVYGIGDFSIRLRKYILKAKKLLNL